MSRRSALKLALEGRHKHHMPAYMVPMGLFALFGIALLIWFETGIWFPLTGLWLLLAGVAAIEVRGAARRLRRLGLRAWMRSRPWFEVAYASLIVSMLCLSTYVVTIPPALAPFVAAPLFGLVMQAVFYSFGGFLLAATIGYLLAMARRWPPLTRASQGVHLVYATTVAIALGFALVPEKGAEDAALVVLIGAGVALVAALAIQAIKSYSERHRWYAQTDHHPREGGDPLEGC